MKWNKKGIVVGKCGIECNKTGEINWFLIALIAGIVLLILVIIIVLFKIFSREKRRGMPPAPDRRIPPEHRPGPKRAPGRPPVVHHGEIGRPPERRISPGGYAVRKYPSR